MSERLYLRGRIWWSWTYDAEGNRLPFSTRCRDKKAAGTVAREQERRVADPHYVPTNETTIEAALKQLIADRRARGRAQGTLDMYAEKSGHVNRLLGASNPLSSITAKQVDYFITTRLDEGAARSTVHKELTTIRATLKVAKRRGEWRGDIDNVMPDGFEIEYEPKDRFLTEAELEALLRELTPDRAARVAWIVATAARWSESDRARREDVDLKLGVVWMRGSKTTAAKAAVPIVGNAWTLLEHALKYGGGEKGALFVGWSNVRRDIHQACDRAKIPHASPNDLRRTNSKWLRQQFVEPHLIAGMLRHKDSRMVERVYGRIPVETLGAALRERLGEGAPQSDRSKVVAKRSRRERPVQQMRGGKAKETSANQVPRGRIELPTRGFSVPNPRGVTADKVISIRGKRRAV